MIGDGPNGFGSHDDDDLVRRHLLREETVHPEISEPVLWSYLEPAVIELTVDGRSAPKRTYRKSDLRLTAPGATIRRRIANARRMIEVTSLPLSEIAYRNGFSSQSHMTGLFTSRLGITPGNLRK